MQIDELRPKRARSLSFIDRANEEVNIFDVLSEFFDIHHPREGKSYKGFCPFGYEHGDGGMEKAWRTYPETNSSNCFAMHGRLTPVRLIQIHRDIKATRAAIFLLEHYGLMKPRNFRERYNEILLEQEKGGPSADTTMIVEALNTALGLHPAFEDVQYRPAFQAALEEELRSLDGMVDTSNDKSIRAWYAEAKERLQQIVIKEAEEHGG